MPSEKITFTSASGAELAGVIDLPDGEPAGWGVFSHGFTLGKDSLAAVRVCRGLAAEGIAMLRFDNLGLGHSGGRFADTSFGLKTRDTVLAARALRERGHRVDLLVGHSLGGAAVLAAAGEVKPRAVATIGAPYSPRHLEKTIGHLLDEIEANGSAELVLGTRSLEVTRAFVKDLEEHDLAACIRDLGAALMVMHSPTDNTVGIANAGDIFAAAKHPKSFFALDGADHLLTGRVHGQRAARMIAVWAEPYLGERD
ncbi:MAG: alpha/beta fold hydrolase [Arthrobacter sp.]|uniref:alpha/beta hydrolase family protein n=1 Tax=Arthrobacter sp. TaxID=1667 RepID=UPI003490DDBA